MALTGKSKKDTYKDLLELDNSNAGLPATTPKVLKDGLGNSSALRVSKDKVQIKNNTTDSTTLLTVDNSGGTTIFAVDGSNALVKVNTSQNYANTQYVRFSARQLNAVANTWYPLYWGDGGITTDVADTLGTSGTPATTLTASFYGVFKYWYIHDNITLDAVRVFHMGDDSASTDTLQYSLNAFTVDTSGSGSGDLSSGVVHASSSSQTIDNADMDTHTLTLGTPNIDAGKVALMLVRGGSSINNDITASVHIKYHIR